ncbi:hypothetical protein F4821DRAFT_280477 [Hypoxylon rubiginosum]|uniref:Uncharacterized protein n=1 Tax=Hypoxylon rubiginosum TaxID=110542 RepID=A0ACC0CU23_9PEZI|nr:hypothetical protein F4821DRAFT_280477 [Hypoxylon rubiginosum]
MSSTISQKASWAALSTEIQLLILGELVCDNDCRLARLATVSRQWQYVIERHNFERIKLTIWRMPEFGPMTCRNRALIKSIWLSLELEEYECSICEGRAVDGNGRWSRDGSDWCIIINAMRDLFWILSAWETQPQKRLTLDISIYSPSDSRHHFKYLTFGPDAPLDDRNPTFSNQDDPRHGWIAGKLSSAPSRQALEYVHREILAPGEYSGVFWNEEYEKTWWQSLPEAPVVSSILFRLQNRRRFAPTAFKCMFSRLPNLEAIHYEPWRVWSPDDETETDKGNCLLLESLAPSLKNLVLFENFDEQYSSQFLGNDNVQIANLRTPNRSMGRAVAKASLTLQHLSASFIIEADHFLGVAEAEPAWSWPHLRSLTLTSRLLNTKGSPGMIDQMLLEAASVALKMPRLETFEIWNGQVGSAALFRYQTSDYGAVLSWKANWEHTIPSYVVEAWEAVAHAAGKNSSPLPLEYSVDDAIRINSHADAINYLELFKVLRPISLQQILAAHTARDVGLPQGLGPRPTVGHANATATDNKSSFAGKTRAKALAYYKTTTTQYYIGPARESFVANMPFNPIERPER